jgi:hypothetical protein
VFIGRGGGDVKDESGGGTRGGGSHLEVRGVERREPLLGVGGRGGGGVRAGVDGVVVGRGKGRRAAGGGRRLVKKYVQTARMERESGNAATAARRVLNACAPRTACPRSSRPASPCAPKSTPPAPSSAARAIPQAQSRKSTSATNNFVQSGRGTLDFYVRVQRANKRISSHVHCYVTPASM